MSDLKSELRRGRYYIAHIASLEQTDITERAARRIEDLEDALRDALSGQPNWKEIAKKHLS